MITSEYKIGPCVLNEGCKHPDQELRPHHRCPDCFEIVHVLCGQFDAARDVYVCGCMMQPQKEGKMTVDNNDDVEQLCAKPFEGNDQEIVEQDEEGSNEPNKEQNDDQEKVSTNYIDLKVTEIDALLSVKPIMRREDDEVRDQAKIHEPQAIEIDMTQGDHMALVSTITQSTTDASYKEIPRDYFITRDQKINKISKERDGQSFVIMRKEILKEISDNLKTMMIMKAQGVGLSVKDKKNQMRGVKSYADIGLAWKQDGSVNTAGKINTIVNTTFTDSSGYEFYLEAQIMKKFKLRYTEGQTKGSIARMIVLRKCELAKVINKRSESTHQKKILKIRCEVDTKDKRRMKTNSFRINEDWYNDDCSVYDEIKTTAKTDDSIRLVEKIKELERELKIANEVFDIVQFIVVCYQINTHSFLFFIVRITN